MIQAMGGNLTDKNGEELPRGGIALSSLASIDISSMDPRMLHALSLIHI